MDSDYPFGIFKLFCCVNLDIVEHVFFMVTKMYGIEYLPLKN